MIQIPMHEKGPFDRNTLQKLNHGAQSKYAPQSLAQTQTAASSMPVTRQNIPIFANPMQKGQKATIGSKDLHAIQACFGWNVKNPQCDADISAFLLGANGKVLGDSWFVFYGQIKSPDGSTELHEESAADPKTITIRLDRLNPSVKKIVFVLTIHEAFEKNLNFGMITDAYIRILHPDSHSEAVSFQMKECSSNVISMMIGEIYLHNDEWKFGAIGNGIAGDLAGLCAFYGVEVTD